MTANTSFEVHLGYPGPAYWGWDSSPSLLLGVLDEVKVIYFPLMAR
jgi:hypothetical protein